MGRLSVIYSRQVSACYLAGLELVECADRALLVAKATLAHSLVGLHWHGIEVRQVAVAYLRIFVVLRHEARVVVAVVDCHEHLSGHPVVISKRLTTASSAFIQTNSDSRPTRRRWTTLICISDYQTTLLSHSRQYCRCTSFMTLWHQTLKFRDNSWPLYFQHLLARKLCQIIWKLRRIKCNIQFVFCCLLWRNTCVLAESTLLEETRYPKLSNYGVARHPQLIICVSSVWREFHVVNSLDIIMYAGFILR